MGDAVGPVALFADAGEGAGLGHVSRSSAIAVALRLRGLDVHAYALDAAAPIERDGVTWRPLPAEDVAPTAGTVAVLDSYGVAPAAFADDTAVVVLVDDGSLPSGARLAVKPSAEPTDDPRVLAGLAYACLRPVFWGLPQRSLRAKVSTVLLTTGATDIGGAGHRLAEAVRAAIPHAELVAVVGPHATGEPPAADRLLTAPSTLLEALLEADLIVTAGGQTLLEAVATGTPTIAVAVVENQRLQVEALARQGATVAAALVEAEAAIRGLAADVDTRSRLAARGQELVDGYGALRVAFAIDRLRSTLSAARPKRSSGSGFERLLR